MAPSVGNNRVSSPGYCGLCGCCKFCNMWCWRVFKWLPVLLIVSIVTWSYYAYVIQLCKNTVETTVQKVIYLVVYHILLIMFAWSYWRTIFAEIKTIPDKYKLPEAEMEKLLRAETEDSQRQILENFAKDLPLSTRILPQIKKIFRKFCKKKKSKKEILEVFANSIPVLTRTLSGSVRYCNRCVLIKPDRAHHCSICARCVLKMDHHCPWVNNCVCFHNYKFFMLFLGYALLYCLFIAATCLPYFIRFWKASEFGVDAGRYHIVFAFFVSLMFAISLGSLFGYHCFLVSKNRTTLEEMKERHIKYPLVTNLLVSYEQRFRGPTKRLINHLIKRLITEAFRAPMFRGGADKNGFSLGVYNNFKEVFGNNPNLWIVPVFTSVGDGSEFPVRREHQLHTFTAQQDAQGYESMGTTRSSFGDGIVFPLPRPDEDTESLLSSERWERWGERARPFDERESSSFDEL